MATINQKKAVGPSTCYIGDNGLDLIIKVDERGRVFWCDDWATLGGTDDPRFKFVHSDPYCHTDIFYRPAVPGDEMYGKS